MSSVLPNAVPPTPKRLHPLCPAFVSSFLPTPFSVPLRAVCIPRQELVRISPRCLAQSATPSAHDSSHYPSYTLPHDHPDAPADPDHPLARRLATAPVHREPCVLVGVDITTLAVAAASSSSPTRIFSLDSSLDELTRLAETAGLSVDATLTQTLPTPDPSTYIRSGKVSELRSILLSTGACTTIFDTELSPGQQRALEHALSTPSTAVKVLDRPALILDIFAQHAATREGHLQVELALYQYRLPRLTRMWTHLGRQSGAGGVGLRGPGETQLEVDRRLIAGRVARLQDELRLVRAHRKRLRTARRNKVGAPVVALVGYTNAGKSSLLNALTGARALAADALFATLDPTTRRARLAGVKMSPEVLLTDTVGFVQNLPTQLVAAFRATLEEVVEADLLVHVVDGAVEAEVLKWQMEAVQTVIEEIGAGGKPTVIAVNKVDLLDDDDRVEEVRSAVAENGGRDAVAVSARSGLGLEDIGVMVEEALREAMMVVDVEVPYTRGELIGMMYEQGCVLAEEFVENGTRVTARVPGTMWERLRPYFVDADAGDSVFGGADVSRAPSEGGNDDDTAREEQMWADLAKKRHFPRGCVDS